MLHATCYMLTKRSEVGHLGVKVVRAVRGACSVLGLIGASWLVARILSRIYDPPIMTSLPHALCRARMLLTSICRRHPMI